MAQCQAITRGGVRCKRQAVAGSAYCPVHQRSEPSPLRPTMLGGATRRVRYLGHTPFLAGSAMFTPQVPVLELSEEQALYLAGKLPHLFHLEE